MHESVNEFFAMFVYFILANPDKLMPFMCFWPSWYRSFGVKRNLLVVWWQLGNLPVLLLT